MATEISDNQSTIQQSNNFSEMGLPNPLLKALHRMGFQGATPVQAQTIPLAIAGKDLISMAETGSGKTAAYLIPTLARILSEKCAPQDRKLALVLAPTRELSMQIADVARELTQFVPQFSTSLLVGGMPMDRQIRGLKQGRPALIIATPGRLMDHHRRRTIQLQKVGALILDEADRMFDMGFAPQVREIVSHIPTERQTMLFSATFPRQIRELSQTILVDPAEVCIQKQTRPPTKIAQKVVDTSTHQKNDHTLDFVNAATGSVLIFARTKHRTDRLADYLQDFGVKVARLHGDRSQGQRNQAIQGFKSGKFRVLVATDIAARGIDVSSVSDVINYDLPACYEDYVHRIGRTGRAGRDGQAINLITNDDRHKWLTIARKLGLAPAQPNTPKKKSSPPPWARKKQNNFRGANGKGFRPKQKRVGADY